MHWLNLADARRFGIDVQPVNLPAEASAESAPRTPSRSSEQEPASSVVASIKGATYDFITATNRPNDHVIIHLQDKYDEQVDYFGKMLSKAAVLADRQSFFVRWPKRDYSVRPESILVTCENDRSCAVEGILDWTVADNAKTSAGSANFSIGWRAVSGVWKISSEISRVIGRRISPAASDPLSTFPRYQLDEANRALVSLSNLYPDPECASALITGKIVRRTFEGAGLTPTGVVIEAPDGSRDFVNTYVQLDGADMVTRGWVIRGLQTLLSEGRSAELYVKLCGAAGRVENLDALR
jgi:hypothetical protein